jgi:hypothetical protein
MHGPKPNKVAVLAILVSFYVLGIEAVAAESRQITAASPAGPVRCLAARTKWFVLSSTGPCDNFVPPRAIRIGQTFSEGGTIHTINIITAAEAPDDMQDGAVSIKAGDTYCAAAERPDDLENTDDSQDRTWLFIPKCVPLQ